MKCFGRTPSMRPCAQSPQVRCSAVLWAGCQWGVSVQHAPSHKMITIAPIGYDLTLFWMLPQGVQRPYRASVVVHIVTGRHPMVEHTDYPSTPHRGWLRGIRGPITGVQPSASTRNADNAVETADLSAACTGPAERTTLSPAV